MGELLAPDMELRRAHGLGGIEGGDEVIGLARTPDAFAGRPVRAGRIARLEVYFDESEARRAFGD